MRTTLIKALRHAERFGYVERNVAQLVDLPKAPRPTGRSLSVGEAKALLQAAHGDRLEALIGCGLLLGLRPGEALGIQWSNIDFDANHLSVTNSLKRERNLLRLGDTKTPQSVRTLDMPVALVAMLRRRHLSQLEERVAAGEMWAQGDLVFTTEIGTPIDPSNYRRTLDRLCAKADIGHWSPNELRHSFASLLSDAGVPLELVADAMGHVDTRMTSAVYRHRIGNSISAAARPMESIFERS